MDREGGHIWPPDPPRSPFSEARIFLGLSEYGRVSRGEKERKKKKENP